MACAVLAAFGARADEELPTYPGAVSTRIGGDLVIGGERHQIAYFTTGDSMKQVAQFFHRRWVALGYPTTLDGDLTTEAVIAAFDTREGLLRSVVLRTHQGKTLGFGVQKDLWVREPPLARPERAPLEGTLFSEDLWTRDDPSGAWHRALLATTDLETTRGNLHRRLVEAGYEMLRETHAKVAGGLRRVLEYGKGKEQLFIALVEAGVSMTAVSQTWVRLR